jgi:acetoacetyl-CoA reductase
MWFMRETSLAPLFDASVRFHSGKNRADEAATRVDPGRRALYASAVRSFRCDPSPSHAFGAGTSLSPLARDEASAMNSIAVAFCFRRLRVSPCARHTLPECRNSLVESRSIDGDRSPDHRCRLELVRHRDVHDNTSTKGGGGRRRPAIATATCERFARGSNHAADADRHRRRHRDRGGDMQSPENAGYRVAATYFGNAGDARRFHDETGISTFEWNVADFEACRRGVAEVVRAVAPVDILINNAGITRDATLHKMTPEAWRAVIDVDLGGCFNMCRSVIEGMRERRFGRIVNISSINGLAGQFGQTNYAAAKAGIIGFTKALALEGAARGITVNAIAPGYTDTPMVAAMRPEIPDRIVAQVPVGRLAEPEEIAHGVVFLVGDDAAFITGATLSINGGKYMQ